ncbi:unnamed protein product [Darwinula stevensoni]|uniref:Uncharacterized protein n=1 Tax=Darwinula stevensoni TaxID=69355 RepID=A0A7R8XB61_9CRUS|nr:unnamed protein product [Darwinula stevensoni]CAG0884511.1 unnamed protein product [Darwinula stevensoni]
MGVWLNPLMRLGSKRDLEIDDLFGVPREDESERLGDELQRQWEKELKKADVVDGHIDSWEMTKKDKREVKWPSFLKAIIKTFGGNYALIGILAFIEECVLRVSQPVFMALLIQYFSGNWKYGNEAYWGWLFGTGVILCSLLYTFTHHSLFFNISRCGMQIRVACGSLIYRKALKLSKGALGRTTVGQMVNLLSNDVNRFDQSVIFLHYLWVGPIQAAITTAILWSELGVSCLSGIAILILFIPFQGSCLSAHPLPTGPKNRFHADLKEVHVITRTSYLRGINMSLFYSSSKVILLVNFIVYLALGNELTAAKVFLAVALFNNVRLVMTFFFPFGIAQAAETVISIRRLQDFLLHEELRKPNHFIEPGPGSLSVADIKETKSTLSKDVNLGIEMKNAVASWTRSQDDIVLHGISLSVKPGQLVAIIGPVGSGKSSLVQAVLGELRLKSGELRVRGRLGYTGQEPWVFAGSIRQNITFGKPYDEKLFRRVIHACALHKDLAQFQHQDRSLVGDRGITLSGGQKARVSLARALYQEADIYLLDDPLSAVDAHVGRHLFDKCIMGYLKEKPRILVTHQLQFLQKADIIIVLSHVTFIIPGFPKCFYGKVATSGTYGELLKSGLDFTKLMAQHETSPHHEEEQPRGRERTHSTGSIQSLDSQSGMDEGPVAQVKLPLRDTAFTPAFTEETRSRGNVSMRIYWDYMRAGAGWFSVILLILTNIITQAVFSASDWWLSHWTNAQERATNETNGSVGEMIFGDPNMDPWAPMYVYAAIVVALFFLSLLRTVMFFYISMKSSVNLHSRMFNSVLRAPVNFFDNNPVGEFHLHIPSSKRTLEFELVNAMKLGQGYISRILNRFSKDVGALDDMLPPTAFDSLGIQESSTAEHRGGNGRPRMITPEDSIAIGWWIRRDKETTAEEIVREQRPANVQKDGRILNRFSRDMGNMDELLPQIYADVVMILLMVLGIVIMISIVNWWIVIATVLCCVIFGSLRSFYLHTARDIKRLEGVALQVLGITILLSIVNYYVVIGTFIVMVAFGRLRRFYLKTARDLKRLESVTRSPVFSHLSASLNGLATIRASHTENIFMQEFDNHQDLHTSSWFLFLSGTRWFGIWLDWLIVAYLAAITYSFMAIGQDALGGDVGLAISSAMMLTGMFQWGVRQSAELENQMTSVERIMEYTNLKGEAALESPPDKKPPPGWPSEGHVKFEHVSLRYAPDSKPVLKDLTFTIAAKEKVRNPVFRNLRSLRDDDTMQPYPTWRTGAGKSSLITALFRLTEPEGRILLDGRDTKAYGLHEVRSGIAIIPQDPVLFQGKMRRNLDPFNEHADEALWKVLEQVQLKDAVKELKENLDTKLSEGGSNFSVGQRQLVCLARALLRRNKILVLDEATANVDPKPVFTTLFDFRTDALIQDTLRKSFNDCTVLTIAHRLDTIIDSDSVLVLDHGEIQEFGRPYELLQNKKGFFSALIAQTGPGASRRLHLAAAMAYAKKFPEKLSILPPSPSEVQAEGDDESELSSDDDSVFTGDAASTDL